MLPLLVFLGEFALILLALFVIVLVLIGIVGAIAGTIAAIKAGRFIKGEFKKAEDRTSPLSKWSGREGLPRF
jgi:hypothetical protein